MLDGRCEDSTTTVPNTVERALEDRTVDGRVCREDGAGVGNATAGLLEAHADIVRDRAANLPDDLATPLVERAERLVAEIGTEEVGEMYSLAMRYPEP